jgi:hypothetical protein
LQPDSSINGRKYFISRGVQWAALVRCRAQMPPLLMLEYSWQMEF